MPAKEPHQRIPDLVCIASDECLSEILPGVLQDHTMSFRAKGLLMGLLYGGIPPNLTDIESVSAEGITSIRSAIAELEEHGHLIRVRFRDKYTKQYVGSTWICNADPGETYRSYVKCLKLLRKHGFEPVEGRR